MGILATIATVGKDGDLRIINVKDFDPATMTKWEEKSETPPPPSPPPVKKKTARGKGRR